MVGGAVLCLEVDDTRKWGGLIAGDTIVSIPLIPLFVFSVRLFLKGFSEGGLKG